MPFVHETSLVGRERGRGERLINMALQMVHALEVSGAGWYCDTDEGLFLRKYFLIVNNVLDSMIYLPFNVLDKCQNC